MINKLISVFLACCIACTCLVIPASASTKNLPSNWSHFISDLSDDFNAYRNGNITLTDFFDLYAKDCLKWGYNNVSDVTHFKDVLKGLENLGVDVPKAWEKYFYEYNDVEKDDSILKGYGALLLMECNSNRESTHYIYNYCDYITVTYVNDNLYYAINNRRYYVSYTWSDTVYQEVFDLVNTGYMPSSYTKYSFKLYGDVRYDDGSQADDFKEQLPEKQVPNFDDDSVSDDDLIDFLEDLLNDLQLQYPDLSTIEGLLRAILAKCTDIEKRIDEGGNGLTAAELQSLLDQAVLALTLQNKTNNDAVLKSNDDLLKELINIRKILQGFDSDEEVPPEEANSILQGLISGLTSGLTQLLGFGFGDDDVSEIIEICINAGTVGTKLMSGIVDVIAFMCSLVPFSVIKTLIETTFNIMFNKNAPADLTFTLDNTSYTFLSASFLNIPIVSGTLAIVKGLVSIMILYIWLKWARKFFVNLM